MLLALLVAAQVTTVADAGDERHPLELDVEATYLHGRQETRITRETPAGLVDELHSLMTRDEVALSVELFLPEFQNADPFEMATRIQTKAGAVMRAAKVA